LLPEECGIQIIKLIKILAALVDELTVYNRLFEAYMKIITFRGEESLYLLALTFYITGVTYTL
jgi:hypothetical protein